MTATGRGRGGGEREGKGPAPGGEPRSGGEGAERTPGGSLHSRLLPYGGSHHDPDLAGAEWSSAVAVVLRDPSPPAGLPEILLIRRSRRAGDPWSGHMALPGGRRESADASLLDTAIRETREEVGLELAPGSGSLLGRLDAVAPRSPRLPRLLVVPFVFSLPPGSEPRISSPEVAELFWAGLGDLRDPRRSAVFRYVIRSGSTEFPAYRVSGRAVWGLTHRIVADLLARMA